MLYVNNRYDTLGVIVIKLLKRFLLGSSGVSTPELSKFNAFDSLNFVSKSVINLHHYESLEQQDGSLRFLA